MVSLDTQEPSLKTSVLYGLVDEFLGYCTKTTSPLCVSSLNNTQILLNHLAPLTQESNIFIYYAYKLD
jgi:hypothetical protein